MSNASGPDASADVAVADIARPREPCGGVEIELPARGEHRVADRLGIEPARACAPEQAVVGIGLEVRRVARAAELVGAAEHDRADELLHRPAVAHELHGERVEQFGMARLLAGRAEIIRRAHEALAEEMQPDAIHQHARGERIRRAS